MYDTPYATLGMLEVTQEVNGALLRSVAVKDAEAAARYGGDGCTLVLRHLVLHGLRTARAWRSRSNSQVSSSFWPGNSFVCGRVNT